MNLVEIIFKIASKIATPNKIYAYRKYDKKYSSKYGKIKRATTYCKKKHTPLIDNSNQNVFPTARSKDGFCFVLYSICQFLRKHSRFFLLFILNVKHATKFTDIYDKSINLIKCKIEKTYRSSLFPRSLERSSSSGSKTPSLSNFLL